MSATLLIFPARFVGVMNRPTKARRTGSFLFLRGIAFDVFGP